MKTKLLLVLVWLLVAAPLFAVGTVTETRVSLSRGGYTVTFSWTADAAAATVPNTAMSQDSASRVQGLSLYMVETNPGTTAPTDNYDITILSAGGADLMGGALADRDTANTELAFPPTPSPAIDGILTFTLSGNSVNSATGTVKLYFMPVPSSTPFSIIGGALNMNNNLITNIGNAGTDFTAGGGLTTAAGITASTGSIVSTLGHLQSSSGGVFVAAAGGFITFGTGVVANSRIVTSAAVGGQPQGIILTRGDGTMQTFANLGAATNGSMIYCSDCTKATPCAGSGTGALAKRLNGAWDCD